MINGNNGNDYSPGGKKQNGKDNNKKEFKNIDRNIKKLCIKMTASSHTNSTHDLRHDLKADDFYKFDFEESKTITINKSLKSLQTP